MCDEHEEIEKAVEILERAPIDLYELRSPRMYDNKIRCADIELLELTNAAEAEEREIRAIEERAAGWVLGALTPEGKARYTNEQQRKIAISEHLDQDDEYQTRRAHLRALERDRALVAIERDSLYRRYQVAKIDYEARILGRRAA